MFQHSSDIYQNKFQYTTPVPRMGDVNKGAYLADNRSHNVLQRKQEGVYLQDNRPDSVLQRKTNNTGLPDHLKSGIENLSGYSMNDVKVHYNSSQPAQLNAHAYAQGTDIHLAPGQEKHLPHEAWHVVQQMQGRVKPTMQMKGKVNVNDDAGLEKEADVMGAKALYTEKKTMQLKTGPLKNYSHTNNVFQLATEINHTTSNFVYNNQATNVIVSEPVGVHMTAVLDPTDPIRGSATQPGGPQQNLLTRLNHLYGHMVRGHLLNHDLGGFAVQDNLFPITNTANLHIHSPEVEMGVKTALTTARTNQQNGNQPDGVYYSVEVDSGMNEDTIAAGSDFVCHAHYLNNTNGPNRTNGASIVDVTVCSLPGPLGAGTSFNTLNGMAPVAFPHANPTPGWAHAGVGANGGAWGNQQIFPGGHIRSANENENLTWLRMQANRTMRGTRRVVNKGMRMARNLANYLGF